MIQTIKSKIKSISVICVLSIALFYECNAKEFKFIPHLQKEDIIILQKSLKEGDRAKWSRSLRIAKQSQSVIVNKIATWRWLSASDAIASFQKTKEFFLNNTEWPDKKVLQRRLENRLSYNSNKDSVLLWFQENKPISGQGKIKLAEALIKSNFKDSGYWLIRKSWIDHNYTFSEEKMIINKYKNIITYEDHAKRLDRLIWSKTWGSARRQLQRVTKDIKTLGTARIKLSRRKPNVDRAVAAVPKHLINSESLIYERVRWRRKAGLEKKSLDLLVNYTGNLQKPDKWWYEMSYHIRKQLHRGNINTALKIIDNHRQIDNAYSSEAQWLGGWISLQFKKNPSRAYEYFTNMFANVSTPISSARAAYWSGRSAESLGDKVGSQMWFERAAALPSTFYGQLSLKKIGKKIVIPIYDIKFTDEELETYSNRVIIQALVALIDSGHKRLSRKFTLHIVKEANNSKEILMLAKILEGLEKNYLIIALAKKAVYENLYIPRLNFPIPNIELFSEKNRDKRIPIYAALAVSRQESAFDKTARSRAGALGLMQLMPRTARETAKLMRLKYSKRLLTANPEYNVKIASRYLADLLKNYDGSYVLALAAYNAGPKRVRRWLRINGDPRKNEINDIDWMELIPIKETRNYVQRVIEGMYMYKNLLKPSNNNSKYSKIKFF